jgi:hypothetical protein
MNEDAGRFFQALSLVVMAVLMGSRYIPALRPYATRIGLVVFVAYFVLGLAALGYLYFR